MKLEINEKGILQLEKVFVGITLKTDSGEEMTIQMRDCGFEFEYQGKWYFAKEGYVEPFHKSIRGNYLVEQFHQELVDIATIPDTPEDLKQPFRPNGTSNDIQTINGIITNNL